MLGGVAALGTGCGSGSHRDFLPSSPTPGASPNAGAPVGAGAITLRMTLPGVGPSYAPVVSYPARGHSARITGLVDPPNAAVLLEPQTSATHGFRALAARLQAGHISARVDLGPGANTFDVVALKPGLLSQTAQVVITSDQPGISADLLAATQAADQTNAPVTISPHAKRGLGQAPSTLSLAAPTIDRINAPPPPASGGPGRWLSNFEVTEYYPIPESLFSGPFVMAPGLSTAHRQDWLYGPRGVVLEGDGIGLDGLFYHVVDVHPPYSFAPGPSQPLSYYRSLAVDPRVIPFGSHVYIPAYRRINGGWFEADDTGGAIIGNHVDVFRPPPQTLADTGALLQGQPVYVQGP